MAALSVNILDEGGGYYRFHELNPDNKCEAWLPDGRYWLDIGRPGGILGPTPFRVNGEELSDIDFTIEQPNSTWMKVPVELSRSSPGSATDKGSVRSCGFVNAYFVRFDRQGYAEVGDNLLLSVPGEPCGAHKPATASMVPGEYTLVAEMSGPNYVKAIKSGNFDLSDGPLKVLPGQIPEMIRIELAEGGGIKGSLQFEGKPAKAFVYTLPLEIASKTDFRLFGSVFAKEDGTFEISGLAPGSYRVFASNVELELNKAHLAANAFWLTHGKKIDVLAGETTEVELTAFEPQYEP